MKKFLTVVAIFAVTMFSANAQIKIGVFDENSVLGLFPDIAKIDSILNAYAQDSLQNEYEYLLSDLKYKDSVFKADSAKMSPSRVKIMTDDINRLKYQLVNWQQYQEQAYQNKQGQLLRPYQEKIFAALREVVQEQKYTHVFQGNAFSPYTPPPLADNLSIKVAQKLKLKLPQEVEDALKQAGLSTGSTSPAPKPGAPKPGTKN
jgi:Skp family chaperone for outer membrane proteins